MPKKVRVERRKYPRVKRVLCIHHRLHRRRKKFAEDRWHWHLSNTENMSAGGLLFTSDVVYNVGDTIELKIEVSGVLDAYDGLARIVRVEKKTKDNLYPTAVQFLKPPTANI